MGILFFKKCLEPSFLLIVAQHNFHCKDPNAKSTFRLGQWRPNMMKRAENIFSTLPHSIPVHSWNWFCLLYGLLGCLGAIGDPPKIRIDPFILSFMGSWFNVDQSNHKRDKFSNKMLLHNRELIELWLKPRAWKRDTLKWSNWRISMLTQTT
jgi:hypothetical protein